MVSMVFMPMRINMSNFYLYLENAYVCYLHWYIDPHGFKSLTLSLSLFWYKLLYLDLLLELGFKNL